jgi:thiol-disulfide isomerase/thioredoxin
MLTLRRWHVGIGLVLAGLIALAAGVYFGRDTSEPLTHDMRGKDAAPLLGISLPDTKGVEQPLGQWKGKVLVVNFWATWCVPCREEMPQFVRVQRELGDRGVQFVGIAIDQPDKIDAFAAELHLNYPSLVGGYGAIELSKTMGNRLGALPFTVIVDRAGRVAQTQLGLLKEANLRSILAQLL